MSLGSPLWRRTKGGRKRKRPLQNCRGRNIRGTTSIYCINAASAGPISPWRCIGRSRHDLLAFALSHAARKGISTSASRCLAPSGSSLKGQSPTCTWFSSSRWVWMDFSTNVRPCQACFGKKQSKNNRAFYWPRVRLMRLPARIILRWRAVRFTFISAVKSLVTLVTGITSAPEAISLCTFSNCSSSS